jgi:hypothetical protein
MLETKENDQLEKHEHENQYLTIRQFCASFPWPSESALRAYIYKSSELGISEAFIRVKRRVLIQPSTFFSLIRHLNPSNKGENHEMRSEQAEAVHL